MKNWKERLLQVGWVVVVLVCVLAAGLTVSLLRKVSEKSKEHEAALVHADEKRNTQPPPVWLLYQDDRAILVKVKDGDCAIYVLEGASDNANFRQVSVAVGQGCK